MQRLKHAAETAKIDLSLASTTRIDLPFIHYDGTTSYHLAETITRYDVEKMLEPWIRRTLAICEKALKTAFLSSLEIDAIVLVGGSTRIPLVQMLLRAYFGTNPIGGLRREDVVALGAAIQANIMAGNIGDHLLIDVTPLPLGIETLGGVSITAVPRSATIPTKSTIVVSTSEHEQETMTIRICQGEATLVDHNKLLGQFDIVDIPRKRRGEPQIEVVFDIDANGVLTSACGRCPKHVETDRR